MFLEIAFSGMVGSLCFVSTSVNGRSARRVDLLLGKQCRCQGHQCFKDINRDPLIKFLKRSRIHMFLSELVWLFAINV